MRTSSPTMRFMNTVSRTVSAGAMKSSAIHAATTNKASVRSKSGKRESADGKFFTVGVSVIGGPDIIGGVEWESEE